MNSATTVDMAATIRTVNETWGRCLSTLARSNAEGPAARDWRWVRGRGFSVPQRGSGGRA